MEIIAQFGLIIILSIFLLFHFLIILKIVPYNTIWGGRLNSEKEMYIFEIVSILMNLFFLFIILSRSNILPINLPKIFINIILWFMTILFALNTFGNILSKNKIEKMFFTPITIVLTLFSFILAIIK